MEEQMLRGLALTVVLGVSAQWLAWRLRLPSILLLLLVGFCAGPVTGLLDPDRLFGEIRVDGEVVSTGVLFPAVSLAVALILFEGGLTLRFRELERSGGAVFRLISIGVLVTWVVATGAAWLLLPLSFELCLLLGAILTVTGPTVVGPLLRHIRPSAPAGTILKWEGILVDPVGAILAVLIFQAISEGRIAEAPSVVLRGAVESLLIGSVVGGAGAAILIVALRRHWIPDALQSAAALMLVVLASWVSNSLHHESGLLSVTLMGLALANQRHAPIRHILEFKENLRVLLISSLFILLAARLTMEDVRGVTLRGVGFVVILIVVARPLAVLASTWKTTVPTKARVFLAWMAPRGIVAAAVTSVFAYRLRDAGYEHSADLVPIVFLVIVGTVATYGLTAFPLALRLGLAQKSPQGVLIVGAHRFARTIGKTLKDQGFAVLLVDSNFRHAAAARMEGLRVWHGNILAEHADEDLDLAGIGRLLAMTPNDEANALACTHLREMFGRSEVYQLATETGVEGRKSGDVPVDLRGRALFAPGLTWSELERRVVQGWTVRTTALTEKFSYAQFRDRYGEDAVLLFSVTGAAGHRRLTPTVAGSERVPEPGASLISLIPPQPEEAPAPLGEVETSEGPDRSGNS